MNIIALLGASEDEVRKHGAFVMEYAEQGDLFRVLGGGGGGGGSSTNGDALSTFQKLRAAIEIAEALDYLHSQSPPIVYGSTAGHLLPGFP
jgi:serine/threonine protein kinase